MWLRKSQARACRRNRLFGRSGETLKVGGILSGKDGMGVVQGGQETGGKRL